MWVTAETCHSGQRKRNCWKLGFPELKVVELVLDITWDFCKWLLESLVVEILWLEMWCVVVTRGWWLFKASLEFEGCCGWFGPASVLGSGVEEDTRDSDRSAPARTSWSLSPQPPGSGERQWKSQWSRDLSGCCCWGQGLGVTHWNTHCRGLSFRGPSGPDEKRCLGNREWVRQSSAGWEAVWYP